MKFHCSLIYSERGKSLYISWKKHSFWGAFAHCDQHLEGTHFDNLLKHLSSQKVITL